MADIFISYSSKDITVAESVCNQLEQKGFTCWMAPRNIIPGSDWAASISKAIFDASALLLIYSANSAESTQVPKELSLAESRKTFVIPYKVDNAELTGTFEYYLTGSHWIVADPSKNDYKIEELSAIVSGIMQSAKKSVVNNTYIDNLTINNPAPAPTAAAPMQTVAPAPTAAPAAPANGNKKKALPFIIGGAAVLVVAVVAIVLIVVMNTVTVKIDKWSFNDAYNGEILGTYDGEWKNGKPEGKGTFTWEKDGQKLFFDGLWKNGIAEGEGVLTKTGDDYETICTGVFYKCRLTGKASAIRTYTNGDVITWEGEFKDGKQNGYGTFKRSYAEGDITEKSYEGDWADDNYNGKGKYVENYRNGGVKTWEGEWKDGKLNGYAVFKGTYVEGDIVEATYEGYWADDTYNGKGKYVENYRNGDVKIWEGEFKDGKQNGYGTFKGTHVEGDIAEKSYEGDWADDAYNGKGKYVENYRNGDVKIWEGIYKDGKLNGYGTFKRSYTEGDITEISYEGDWADDTYNGKGKYVANYINGDVKIWEGEFKDGKQNGYGTFKGTYVEGDIAAISYEGDWADDTYNGKGKYVENYRNGDVKTWEGEWKDGEFVG